MDVEHYFDYGVQPLAVAAKEGQLLRLLLQPRDPVLYEGIQRS